MVACPICSKPVKEAHINLHIDSDCTTHIESSASTPNGQQNGSKAYSQVSRFFRVPESSAASALLPAPGEVNGEECTTPSRNGSSPNNNVIQHLPTSYSITSNKRPAPSSSLELHNGASTSLPTSSSTCEPQDADQPSAKRLKPPQTSALHRAQPLAERMRPRTLDEVQGQDLLSPNGVLRGLIESDKVPSLILWGGAGTGKTTTARLIAHATGARFLELNATSTGVAELKKIFTESKNELSLTGRKTMVFCDEIHRFSKSQQDVFLGPVEAGVITLVGATTENPSFKVVNALLSRCRVFTLQKLSTKDIVRILLRAREQEGAAYAVDTTLVDEEMFQYLAAFADGDARTGLNLLELAMELSGRAGASRAGIKASLTKTLVYDRAGDQHYDTISAFHKSVRGSDPHATLYYLARMLQSGEDVLYIARRMVVIASEDVGLADNTMLTLATSTYAAAEKIGMPEARINLAHCAVALALARKSTRAYRGLKNAMSALAEPGVAGLPIPVHLRNAPTRLMKEMGYGKEYKYNPQFVDGKVKQEYLPVGMEGKEFLEERDLGEEIDPEWDEQE